MPNEVYQMPASPRDIGPADIFEFLNWWAGEAADIVPLLESSEARMHMLTAAKHLRWAGAAERSRRVTLTYSG
jgi:hypothetical protein